MVGQGVLVVNEIGMGNGVLEFPFALALTRRFRRIVHIRSPFLEPLIGTRVSGAGWEFFPAGWGIDAKHLGCELRQLVSSTAVTHLVNFRNEDGGSEWGNCFAALRDDLRSSGVEVWGLPDDSTTEGSFIQLQWTEMFEDHGIAPDWVGASRLVRSLVSARPLESGSGAVAVCTGGSREDKRLLPELWAAVVRAIKERCPALKVRLVHGAGSDERKLGANLEARIGIVDGGVSVASSVEELANELACAAAVVSNDSFPMHLACALGRPTLGSSQALDGLLGVPQTAVDSEA